MRCQACDKNLNDWESVKKNKETGEFEDLCAKCLNAVIQIRATSTGGYDEDFTNQQTYSHEESIIPERPSDFDYYEEDWDKYD